MNEIIAALEEYGATLSEDGSIQKNGKTFGVRLVIKGNRLRAQHADGSPIASFPLQKPSVESFVEKFWFWEKINV